MARRLLAGLVAAAALGAVGSAAADQLPFLRSATAVDRHVVLRLAVGDLRPVRLAVAPRRAVGVGGILLARNVRLREAIHLPPTAYGVVRWESRKTLRRGIYFVQVQALETGGVTDCPHFLPNCLVHWSNIRRVIVRP